MYRIRIFIPLIVVFLGACQSGTVRPSDPPDSVAAIECVPAEVMVDTPTMAEGSSPAAIDTSAESASEEQVTLESLGIQLAAIDARLQEIGSDVQAPRPSPSSSAGLKPVACPEIPQGDDPAPDKTLLGTLEWIWLEPPGRAYRARVDSGANTSSISAVNVREFERDGKDWVRFTFDHDGEESEAMIERPVERVVLIRQVSAAEPERRPVVLLTVRLGDLVQKTEFTLTDRTEMTFPVLLGRDFLRDLYLIDVAKSYLQGKPKKR